MFMNEEKIANAVEWFAENKIIHTILGVSFWSVVILQTVKLFLN